MLRNRGFDREAQRRALLEQLGQVGPAVPPVLTGAPPPRERAYNPPPAGPAPIQRPNPFTGGYQPPGTQPQPQATFPTASTMQPLSAPGQGARRGQPERGPGPGRPPLPPPPPETETPETPAPEAPTPTPAPAAPTPEPESRARIDYQEQQRRDQINARREERGLPPIEYDDAARIPLGTPTERERVADLDRAEQNRRIDEERERQGLPPIQRPENISRTPGGYRPASDPYQEQTDEEQAAEAEEGEPDPEGWVTVDGLKMPGTWGPYAGPGYMEGYGVHGGPSSYGEAGAENPHYGRQYQVSRVLSHIDPDDPNSLKLAHEAFLKAGIEHKWDGFDRFDFGNGWVDIKHNKRFLKTGEGPNDWTWLEQGGAGGSAEGVGGRGTTEGALGAPGMNTEQLVNLFATDPKLSQLADPSPQFLAFMAGLTQTEQNELIKRLTSGESEEGAEDEEEPPSEQPSNGGGGRGGGHQGGR